MHQANPSGQIHCDGRKMLHLNSRTSSYRYSTNGQRKFIGNDLRKENLLLRSLLGVNPFDVELIKKACVPMYSSSSLSTLSNAPPQDIPL